MKVVVIGGGAGAPLVHKGVRYFATKITGVVAVTDNGRSTGVIRSKDGEIFNEEREVQAPGDLRNYKCSVATKNTWWADIFQQRLRDGTAIGNLIMGLSAKQGDGSMEYASIKFDDLFLPENEKVWPISNSPDVHIECLLEDSTVRRGEVAVRGIDKPRITKIKLNHESGLHLEAIIAINEADLIVFSMGSFISSITPSVLYLGMVDALLRNVRAPKVWVMNTTTQRGQTDGWTPYEHVKFFLETAGEKFLDYVLANTEEPHEDAFRRLKEEKREYLRVDERQRELIESLGVKVWGAPVIDRFGVVEKQWNKDDAIIYHSPEYVAAALREMVKDFREFKVRSNGSVPIKA